MVNRGAVGKWLVCCCFTSSAFCRHYPLPGKLAPASHFDTKSYCDPRGKQCRQLRRHPASSTVERGKRVRRTFLAHFLFACKKRLLLSDWNVGITKVRWLNAPFYQCLVCSFRMSNFFEKNKEYCGPLIFCNLLNIRCRFRLSELLDIGSAVTVHVSNPEKNAEKKAKLANLSYVRQATTWLVPVSWIESRTLVIVV